ncbi:MAG: response regulator [Bacteroidales bacterium]
MDNKALIFVIDDDKLVHRLMNCVLKALSLDNVRNFYSGEECLAHMDKEPQFVFLDFEMRGKNGLQILKAIKLKYPHTKVVMVSGQRKREIVVKTLENGADDYFVKDNNLALTLKDYLFRHLNGLSVQHNMV